MVNRWDVRLGDFCLFCLVSCSTRNVGSEQSRIISSKSTSVCVFFPVGIYSLKDYQWHAWSLLEPHFHLAVAPKSFGGLSELTPSTLFPHLANRIAKVRWAQLGSGKRKNDGEADHRACSVILSECRLSTQSGLYSLSAWAPLQTNSHAAETRRTDGSAKRKRYVPRGGCHRRRLLAVSFIVCLCACRCLLLPALLKYSLPPRLSIHT